MKYISEQNCIREFFIRRSREFVYIANSGNILTRKDVFQQCKPATDSPAPTTSYYLTSSLHTNGSCVSQAMSCYMQNIMWYLVSITHWGHSQPCSWQATQCQPSVCLFPFMNLIRSHQTVTDVFFVFKFSLLLSIMWPLHRIVSASSLYGI